MSPISNNNPIQEVIKIQVRCLFVLTNFQLVDEEPEHIMVNGIIGFLNINVYNHYFANNIIRDDVDNEVVYEALIDYMNYTLSDIVQNYSPYGLIEIVNNSTMATNINCTIITS